MVEAAEVPGPAEAMGWGRAVVIAEMGSVLVAGHNPLGAFVLRAAQAASVPLAGATPLDWAEDAAEMVEVDEACEESEEDELVRCALETGRSERVMEMMSSKTNLPLPRHENDTAVVGAALSAPCLPVQRVLVLDGGSDGRHWRGGRGVVGSRRACSGTLFLASMHLLLALRVAGAARRRGDVREAIEGSSNDGGRLAHALWGLRDDAADRQGRAGGR